MNLSDRNFYHSFPRIRPVDSREHIFKKGLEILKTIQQIGLVLAPEILVWKQALANGEYRTITNRQHRICFTELSRDQVAEHGKRFGPFSLEFRIDALRRLGALPVIYMPQHLKDDKKLSSVGTTIVAKLADIKYTISQLHQMSQMTDPDHLLKIAPGATSVSDNCTIKLQNSDPAGNIVGCYEVPLKNVKAILSYIGYRNAPLDFMIGVLSHVQSLFYPTDDEIHDELLAYYQQREWRIAAGLVVDGVPHSRLLSEEEKKKILSTETGFWMKEVSDDTATFRRIDDTHVIGTFEDKHIAEMFSAVIVPPEAYDDAKAMFGDGLCSLT